MEGPSRVYVGAEQASFPISFFPVPSLVSGLQGTAASLLSELLSVCRRKKLGPCLCMCLEKPPQVTPSLLCWPSLRCSNFPRVELGQGDIWTHH